MSDPSWPRPQIRRHRIDDRASWTTRKEHAKERRGKAIRSQIRPRICLACEQSYTTKSDIMRRYRWKSKLKLWKSVTLSKMVDVFFILISCSTSLFPGSWVIFGSFTRLSLDFWFIIVRCLNGLEWSNALTPCSSSGLLHQTNLRLLLSLNIFSIDQTQRMRKLWAARVRSNTGPNLRFTR